LDGAWVFEGLKEEDGEGWRGAVEWKLGGRIRVEVKVGVGVDGLLMETTLEGESKAVEEDVSSQTKPETAEVPSPPAPLPPPPPPVMHIDDSDSETQCSLSQPPKTLQPTLNPPPSKPFTPPPTPTNIKLFMLKCGVNMSSKRIDILSQLSSTSSSVLAPNVTINVVKDLKDATHIVIDASASKESVYRCLGFDALEGLQTFVEQNNIVTGEIGRVAGAKAAQFYY